MQNKKKITKKAQKYTVKQFKMWSRGIEKSIFMISNIKRNAIN